MEKTSPRRSLSASSLGLTHHHMSKFAVRKYSVVSHLRTKHLNVVQLFLFAVTVSFSLQVSCIRNRLLIFCMSTDCARSLWNHSGITKLLLSCVCAFLWNVRLALRIILDRLTFMALVASCIMVDLFSAWISENHIPCLNLDLCCHIVFPTW